MVLEKGPGIASQPAHIAWLPSKPPQGSRMVATSAFPEGTPLREDVGREFL